MKSTKNKFLAVVSAFVMIIGFSSCQDDDNKAVPESSVTWSLTLPANVENATLSDMKATFTNINTGSQYEGSVSTDQEATTVTTTVPEGLYRLVAEGKISYTISDSISTPTVANIRAYQESVTVSGTTVTLPSQQMSFYNPSSGFVIEEIYFAGSTTPTGDQYSADQYLKIYNNSSEVLYADGLAILQSEFLTTSKEDYTPNLMDDAFTVDFVFVIPGSGQDQPVQPGESLLIALDGSNHQEANTNSFDLSVADFEFFDESSNPNFLDNDNPQVPNLDKWYSYTASYTGLHNRGFKSYALAKMEVDKETFLRDYIYTANWLFVFNEYQIPQEADYYYVPNSWIIDAVNLSIEATFEWIVTSPSLDAGWTHCGSIDRDPNRYNKSVRRNVESTVNGRKILKDTNNSTVDFEADATPSLKE